jgi:protein-tyrosine phosphatase
MAAQGLIVSDVSDWFERFGYAEVADRLLAGAYPLDEHDVTEIAAHGVTRVLNLCEDAEYEEDERGDVETALSQAGIEERRLQCPDYGGLLPGQLESATNTVLEWLEGGERVYLHCRAGWQRSAAVAAGVIARRDAIAIDDALAEVRRRKPSAEPLPHQIEDLRRWWRMRSVRKDA